MKPRLLTAAIICALGVSAFAHTSNAAQIIQNGSFETGDFTSWSTATTGGPFRPWAVSGGGQGGGFGMATTQPQDGSFVAWNGFDGGGPMEFHLFQDVVIPLTTPSATLSWKHRAQWNFTLGGTATLARLFQVEILDPTDSGVLATLFSFSTGTQATNPTGDTGWLTTTVDISAFIGQTVRVLFRELVPQSGTGPAQLELDGIRLDTGQIPEPAALALFALGLAGLAVVRRRKVA